MIGYLWYLLWRGIIFAQATAVIAIVAGILIIIMSNSFLDFPWWIGQIVFLILLIFIEKKVKPKADKKYQQPLSIR
jgi:hypothetical protein